MKKLLIGLMVLGSIPAIAGECSFVFAGGNHFKEREVNAERYLSKNGWNQHYSIKEDTGYSIKFDNACRPGSGCRTKVTVLDLQKEKIVFTDSMYQFDSPGPGTIFYGDIVTARYNKQLRKVLGAVPNCKNL